MAQQRKKKSSKNIPVNEVRRQAPSREEIARAKKKGFIYGDMSPNVQADQVSKMKFEETVINKKGKKSKKKSKK